MIKKNILIVEDYPMMRIAINTAVSNQKDMIVVGEAATVAEGKRILLELKPDLLLLDLFLPDGNGKQLIECRNALCAETKILVITSANKEEDILAVLKAGAEGIIGKNAPSERLQYAIREVLEGKNFLMDAAAKAIINALRKNGHPIDSLRRTLSSRELQVIGCLARGAANKKIARELVISESTVRTHLQHISQKLGLQNKNELIVYAAQHFYGPTLDE